MFNINMIDKLVTIEYLDGYIVLACFMSIPKHWFK